MLLATLTSLVVPLYTWLVGPHDIHHDHGTSSTSPAILSGNQPQPPSSRPSSLTFELRHLHAVSNDAHVVFHDVNQADYQAWALQKPSGDGEAGTAAAAAAAPTTTPTSYSIATRPVKSYRPPSFSDFSAARTRSFRFAESTKLQWEPDEVPGPDVEKRETLLLLAKMSNNAYVEPGDPYWYDLGKEWNNTYPFGWEPDADGFRGQVFATEDNSTVVVSIKGTSAGMFGGGGPTVKKDKFNDNLLFSCCCARIDWTWTTVCDCYRGSGKCDHNCLERALIDESLFYPIGTNLYNNLTYMYPTSNVWIIGHSLGGALASLLGVTFGNPVVAFESPGERLASTRLHLPQPPSLQHITHVYHTADPIAMGTCNGVLSSCALGGYALETGCHLGKSIIYDTVTHLGWSVDIRTHGIINVIDKILSEPWAPLSDQGREVPEIKSEVECVECYSWEFGDFPKPEKLT